MVFQDNNTNNNYDGTLTKDSETLQSALSLCKKHFDNGAYQAALDCILPLEKTHPGYPEVPQAIATIYLREQKNQQAVDVLETFLQANPNAEPILKMIADIYFNHNMFSKAKTYFMQLNHLFPNEAVYLSRIGDCEFHEQNFQQAIDCYTKSIDVNPSQARALNNLGTAYIATNQTDKGLASYEQACQVDPQLVEAQNNLGLHYMDVDPARAKDYFQQALTVRPNFLPAKFNFCLLLLREKHYQAVIETLSDLETQDIEVKGQSHLISDLYLHCHDYIKALEYLEIALEMQPDNVEFRKNAIIMAEHIKLADKVHYHLTEGLRIAPNNLELLLLKANIERTQGNFQKAKELLEEILNQDPGLINAYISLSLTLLESGNPHASIVCSELALSHAPDSPDIHHMLAIAYIAALEPHKAMSHAVKAIEISPIPQHYLTMGEILQEQNNEQEAYTYYATACEKLKEAFANKAADDVIYYETAEVDAFARCLLHYVDTCQWQALNTHRPLLEYLMHDDVQDRYPISPRMSQYLYKDNANLLITVAEKLAQHITRPAHRCYQHPTKINPEKISIGYLSYDFKESLIGLALQSILPFHSQGFSPRLYSLKSYPKDGIYQQFLHQTDIPFIDISQKTNKQAADLIFKDNVDILIDLCGYSEFSRPEILAYMPAPIQLHYLTYQGTMGASFIPYHILSTHQVNDKLRSFYTERLVALDSAPIAMHPLERISPARSKEAIGLPEDKTILATQCPAAHLTQETFDTWINCLKAESSIVLWIRTSSEEAIQAIQSHVSDDLKNRVIIEQYDDENDFHDIQQADIYLDTFEHSQSFMLVLALTQNIPIVTVMSFSPQGQFGSSMLRSFNLDSLICENAEQLPRLIKELANLETLNKVKSEIATKNESATLFKPDVFVQDFEQVLKTIVLDADR